MRANGSAYYRLTLNNANNLNDIVQRIIFVCTGVRSTRDECQVIWTDSAIFKTGKL